MSARDPGSRSGPGTDRLERLSLAVLGLYLVGTGGRHLAAGEWSYADLLAVRVPSPVALAAGALLLGLAVRGWRRI